MPEWVYIRWLGSFCNIIPMIFSEIISFLGGTTPYGQAWILLTFLPLIFLGYILDLFYSRIPIISHLQNPLLKIGLSWMLLYPLASFLRDIFLYALVQEPALLTPYQMSLPMKIAGMLLLGFMYGVFFSIAYTAILQFIIKQKH